MRVLPLSLIGRLRRHLAMAVWTFALVVVGQGALATLCFAEGLGGSNHTSAVAAETHAVVASADSSSRDALCLHAGSGGCHCTCAHASGLPVIASAWPLDHVAAGKIFAGPSAPYSAPRSTGLRPPIA